MPSNPGDICQEACSTYWPTAGCYAEKTGPLAAMIQINALPVDGVHAFTFNL